MTLCKKLHIYFVSAILLTLLTGCGDSVFDQEHFATTPGNSDLSSEGAVPLPPTTDAGNLNKICSALNFDKVTWPEDYSLDDETAFALAMNITGSLEGHSGWENLSNNFDGQGVSMGILNQNLGQGSLQPLWIAMRNDHRDVLESIMTPSMLSAMLSMLNDWERKSLHSKSFAINTEDEIEKVPLNDRQDGVDKLYGFIQTKSRSTSASVAWAKRTLYSDSAGRVFKSAWKTALKKLASHPAYVSLQIRAARYIHDRAHGYRRLLGWNQLHSYLFLFDIVVQNGSLKQKHFDKMEAWLSSQKRTLTEQEEMKALLEIRVVDSNPIWQDDVRKRKTAIINGKGFVHGENRKFTEEYCYDPEAAYQSPQP